MKFDCYNYKYIDRMEYQKITNLLHNTYNHSSKFRRKNLTEVNDDGSGLNNTNKKIKFKTTILKLSLCDDNDAYILIKRTTTFVVLGANNVALAAIKNNKQGIFKNRVPFTLHHFTSLFLQHNLKINVKVILDYFFEIDYKNQ